MMMMNEKRIRAPQWPRNARKSHPLYTATSFNPVSCVFSLYFAETLTREFYCLRGAVRVTSWLLGCRKLVARAGETSHRSVCLDLTASTPPGLGTSRVRQQAARVSARSSSVYLQSRFHTDREPERGLQGFISYLSDLRDGTRKIPVSSGMLRLLQSESEL